MKKSLIFLLGLIVLIAGSSSFIAAKKSLPANQEPAVNLDFGKVPVFFVPNQGQVDGRINFYIRGKDKTIYFSPDEVTFALNYSDKPEIKKETRSLFHDDPVNREDLVDKNLKRWIVRMGFEGARRGVKPEGIDKTGAIVSYFKGKPDEWKTGLPAYSKIIYRDLWPKIDLVYRGEMNRFKYEFLVHPGGDPEAIRLALRGADKVWIKEGGQLGISTPGGSFEDEAPVAYQETGEKRFEVPIAYQLREASGSESRRKASGQGFEQLTHHYSFEIGTYDKNRDLVLDPVTLVYCGYAGGAGWDVGRRIAVDGSGNAYITGYTASYESVFPVSVGPDLTYNGGLSDAFVAKINPSGTSLVYCGYIGGSWNDDGYGIAVDGSGNAYITGFTASNQATFPVSVGPDLTYNGDFDAFVAKVNSSGTSLVYCGYIGGSYDDNAFGIAVDGSGNSYITGYTSSDEATFPVSVGPGLVYAGTYDAFVAKINSTGALLVYCGYIGGASLDASNGIAVDGSGNAYIAGYTASDEATFPVSVGPDLTFNGTSDAFVAKINSSGTSFVYCGYIGGSEDEDGRGIAVDGSGNAYIAGYAYSSQTTFPVSVGPDLTYNGNGDGFVAKVNPDGATLVYCGYIGGSSDERCQRIALDGPGNAYIIGYTQSTQTTFPVKVGPDLTHNGDYDAFVAKLNSGGTALVYCGYIGGSSDDAGHEIALDGSGNAYIVGITYSDETRFPVTVGPDLTYNEGGDAFVAKISSYSLLNAPVLTSPAAGAISQPLDAVLQWQDTNSIPQEQGYKIRLKKSGGSYAYFTVSQDATSYQPSGLALNTTYYWNVQAIGNGSSIENSAWGSSGKDWSFKIIAKATLNPPTLQSPGNGATGQYTTLALQWQDTNSLPQELTCKVRIKAAGGGYKYYTANQNTISYMAAKLLSNKTYYWNVQALGNGTTIITSAWANSGLDFAFTTGAPVTLSAPTLSGPGNGTSGQPFDLNLQWVDPNSSPQEVGHKIRIKAGTGAYTYANAGQNVISILKTGLAVSKTYYWNVQAAGDGMGIMSSEWANGGVDWSFTTSAPVTLNPPGLVAPADNAPDQPLNLNLQWADTNSVFQEKGYQIRIKPAGGAYTNVTTAKNVVSYLKKALAKNKTYYWNVRALGNGTSTKNSLWANSEVDWKFSTIK
jgi:hypothetical protein